MQQYSRNFFRQNRIFIWCAPAATVILLTVFKLIYPYPNMVLDSYYYIMAAMSHAAAGPWAIGYSWFLRVFGLFSHSPLLLVVFQYFFLETCLLVFFLTLIRFFTFSGLSKWLLFIFFFSNPLLLYCANFVMADALFISLSVLWINLLLRIIFRPNPYLLWVHAILILLVFSVRYNALYYPFVATAAFFLSRYTMRQKLVGIGLQVIVIGSFMWFTSVQIGAISGKAQFSPFGNWKTANDALYMYGHIYQEQEGQIPEKFLVLHQLTRRSFEAKGAIVDDLLNYESPFYGSMYMFFDTSPLVQYKTMLYGSDSEFVNFKKMAYVGPLYGQYGAWLIRQHPVAFLQYFIGPNAIRYFFPPMEAFASLPPFFLRPDYLGNAARNWFGVNTISVGWSRIRLRDYVLAPYQSMAAIIHLLFVLNIIAFLVMKAWRSIPKDQLSGLAVLILLWVCDMGFNLTAAATVMRYEIFLLGIEFSLVIWLTERIYFNRPLTN